MHGEHDIGQAILALMKAHLHAYKTRTRRIKLLTQTQRVYVQSHPCHPSMKWSVIINLHTSASACCNPDQRVGDASLNLKVLLSLSFGKIAG